MKRRVCSYDMFAVPDPSFVLKDTVGEMYLSNLRCFLCLVGAAGYKGRTFCRRQKNGVDSLTTHRVKSISSMGLVDGARLGDGQLLLDEEVSRAVGSATVTPCLQTIR
jgi:hypothetical protein